MREKIFSICHEFGIGNLSDKEVIDQILSYQSEEIEKVAKLYQYVSSPASEYMVGKNEGAQDAIQKILDLFK